jgi:competence protein ComEC
MFERIAHSPSRSLAVCLLTFIAGVAVASILALRMPYAEAIWVGCVGLIVAAAFIKKNKTIRLLAVAGLLLLFGAARYVSALPGPIVVSNETREWQGVVVADPVSDIRSVTAVVRVEHARVALSLPLGTDIRYGDTVDWFGKLRVMDEQSRVRYRADASIAPLAFRVDRGASREAGSRYAGGGGNPIIRVLLSLKRAVVASVQRTLPEPRAGFLNGLLIGSSSTLSPDLRADFKATGTAHVVALSGWNITVIAGGLERTLRFLRLRRRARFIFSASGIVLFVIMVGASASIVRAGVMGLLFIFAQSVGRRSAAGNAILAAGALMLALNPLLLRTDLGFLLSFAATLGLIYVAPIIEPLVRWLPKFFGFREHAANTISATVSTLPIVLVAFGRLSFVALPANLLLLPFLPYTMGVGFAGALVGIVSTTLGRIVGVVSNVFLGYCISVVRLFSRGPGSNVTGIAFNTAAAALMVAGMLGVVVWHRHQTSSPALLLGNGEEG